MFSVLPVAKLAVHVVASVSVTKVVGDIIRNNTTVVTTADAVKVWTGGFIIGGLIAEAATKSVDGHLNQIADWYENRKTESPVEVTETTTE